ncbi:MAG: flagellar protein FliT [Proteobacteria bacterium]|nr:flagellar protein FliT [Pseudomonadota bacterium]
MTDAHTEALFARIETFVAESRTMLEQGTLLDASGLDEQVRDLCRAVLQLSQPQRVAHAERMQQLLGQLSALAEDMMAQRDMLAGEIQQLQHQKKAHKAYKVVDASDAYGKKGGEDK